MNFLTIGDTLRIGGIAAEEIDGYIVDRSKLEAVFITEVHVLTEPRILARVDSFPLLCALIEQMYFLRDGIVFFEIGEGFFVAGDVRAGAVHVDLKCWPKTISKMEITIQEYVLYISMNICHLTESMLRAGVDVEKYLVRFPPNLSQHAQQAKSTNYRNTVT